MPTVSDVYKTTSSKISRIESQLIDLIEGWIWEGEVPEVAIAVNVFTSISQGNSGIFVVTNDRFIVNYVTERETIWQQSILRSKSVEVPRKRARAYSDRSNTFAVYEAAEGFPGSHAIGVPVQFEQSFKDAITS